MDRDPFDLTGDVIDGQFRVDSFAGEGDLSIVYKGYHLGVDAPVAIKCLNLPATLDPALVRPLVDGFKEASRVHYKLARGNLNIAQSIASGTTLAPRSGAVVPYMVREWFEGESLASNLSRRRKEALKARTVQEALALLETAFDGISFAHKEGEAHLSINPSNLFLAGRSDAATLKVLDFGIARAMSGLIDVSSGARPEAGLRVLFPAYAAPEQLDKSVGRPGPWTDVYALALVTMEVLSDRVVMAEQETGAIVDRALDPERRPSPRAHGLKLPHGLDLVLTRAVTRAPARRHQSAGDLWRDIQSAMRPRAGRPVPTVVAASAPTTGDNPAEVQPLGVPPAAESAPLHAMTRPKTLMGIGAAATIASPGKGPAVAPTPPPAEAASAPPISLESGSSQAAIDPEAGMAPTPLRPPPLAPANEAPEGPAPTPSSGPEHANEEDTRLYERPLFLPPWRSLASATYQRFLAARDRWVQALRRNEPRAMLLIGAGSLVGTFLLVLLVASVWRTCAGPKPVLTAQASTAPAPPPPAPAPNPEPEEPAPAPEPSRPFNAYAARRALDGTSRSILSCRRDRKWGVAKATVTFANDGSVSQAVVGVPFKGTKAGECVAGQLSTARVEPFAGKEGVVVYQFFVALK
jgi:serine/threonine protein kinase